MKLYEQQSYVLASAAQAAHQAKKYFSHLTPMSQGPRVMAETSGFYSLMPQTVRLQMCMHAREFAHVMDKGWKAT